MYSVYRLASFVGPERRRVGRGRRHYVLVQPGRRIHPVEYDGIRRKLPGQHRPLHRRHRLESRRDSRPTSTTSVEELDNSCCLWDAAKPETHERTRTTQLSHPEVKEEVNHHPDIPNDCERLE